jgi:hypothetical protein
MTNLFLALLLVLLGQMTESARSMVPDVRSEKTSQGNRRSSGLGNLSKISSYLA